MPFALTADSLGLKCDDGQPLRLLVEAGELLYYTGRFEESKQVFEALAMVAPDDPLGALGWPRNANASGDFRRTLEYVAQSIRCRYPQRGDLARGQIYLGDAYMGLSRLRDAGRAWRRSLELAGGDTQVAREVGWRLRLIRQFEGVATVQQSA